MSELFRLSGTKERDSAIEAWLNRQQGELRAIARVWFEVMRECGDDVTEILHDGHPIACVSDAAFAYVNCFKAHMNVGFFRGAELSDPSNVLTGEGKLMRHVKLTGDSDVDVDALTTLIHAAYNDVKKRLVIEDK